VIASEEGVTDDINMGRFFINKIETMVREFKVLKISSFELYNINIFYKFSDYII